MESLVASILRAGRSTRLGRGGSGCALDGNSHMWCIAALLSLFTDAVSADEALENDRRLDAVAARRIHATARRGHGARQRTAIFRVGARFLTTGCPAMHPDPGHRFPQLTHAAAVNAYKSKTRDVPITAHDVA